MDVIIDKSKLNLVITNYLIKNYEPDFGWSESSEYYKNEIDRWGYISFIINDYESFTYFGKDIKRYSDSGEIIKAKTIEIVPYMTEELNSIFSNLWVRPFIDWFEKNTGLEVEHLFRLDRDETINDL